MIRGSLVTSDADATFDGETHRGPALSKSQKIDRMNGNYERIRRINYLGRGRRGVHRLALHSAHTDGPPEYARGEF